MKVLLLISCAVIVGADSFHAHGPATFVQFKQHAPPSPYSFAYDGSAIGGGFHSETGDSSGTKRGSYGIKGSDGRIRTVNYIADAGGFRAAIDTNEEGVSGESPADVIITTSGGHAKSTAGSEVEGTVGGTHLTGYGTADASGSYNFAYGDPSSGPWHTESGDKYGVKTGSYGLQDSDGRVRTVKYVADAGGFRATVSSNEPGVRSESPADVVVSKRVEPSLPAPGTVQRHSAYQANSPSVVRPSQPSGPMPTGYGSIDASGNYNFAYGDPSGGPWQRESGDASGSKSGSYGLKDDDGRVRTVNYVADAAGFRAKVSSNEPGVESGSPADVGISKEDEQGLQAPTYQRSEPLTAPESHGPSAAGPDVPSGPVSTGYGTIDGNGGYSFSYGDIHSGPWQREVGDASNKLGSYGFTGADGLARTVSYSAGDEGFHATITSNEPGVEGKNPADVKLRKSEAPTPEAYGSVLAQPDSSVMPTGSVEGHGGFHTHDDGTSYSFDYSSDAQGGSSFHKESGDASGSKMGSYGLKGADGTVRTVHYVADTQGFRASISSNEPGVDASQNPASTTITQAGGPVSVSHGGLLTSSGHGGQGSGHGRHHKFALVVPVAYISPAALVHPSLFPYKVHVPHWTFASAQQWKK